MYSLLNTPMLTDQKVCKVCCRDAQNNDTQHNATQHYGLDFDTQHKPHPAEWYVLLF